MFIFCPQQPTNSSAVRGGEDPCASGLGAALDTNPLHRLLQASSLLLLQTRCHPVRYEMLCSWGRKMGTVSTKYCTVVIRR